MMAHRSKCTSPSQVARSAPCAPPAASLGRGGGYSPRGVGANRRELSTWANVQARGWDYATDGQYVHFNEYGYEEIAREIRVGLNLKPHDAAGCPVAAGSVRFAQPGPTTFAVGQLTAYGLTAQAVL
jgi:hypothetical protein